MKSRSGLRVGGALLTASLAAAVLAVPTAAAAAPLAAQEQSASCAVTGGTLDWGVKESFRSYISGSIANGSWETSDGAEYETPNFRWSDATGSIDPATGTGTISFTGTVHFTGHDGVLDLTLANPTIEFEGDGRAALLLDAKSTDMEGEVAVDTAQEWVGDVAVEGALAPADDVLDIADLPTTLTNSGAQAFAGFYESGEALDPLTVSLQFDGCDSVAAAPVQTAATPDPEATDTETTVLPVPQVPWLPLVIGGVALLVIGFTVGMLVGGRRPKAAPTAPTAPTAQDGAGAASPTPIGESTPSGTGDPASDDQVRKLYGDDR
ncbi:hypothetical protein GCM10009847_01220 [Leucobacter tardus]|uniref:HtaA domain-containing protein n=1 Tax=Leucobacter tardus TaxID=501483 RepID=A0A939QHM5_9MICO|nr:HtaA domain-containing protein [Leucobacter tardus]MBO2991030.1 HtaA domain-containing protein [Leucobacter tardus]